VKVQWGKIHAQLTHKKKVDISKDEKLLEIKKRGFD